LTSQLDVQSSEFKLVIRETCVCDVFISYAREDRATAERLAHALSKEARSVWWDREIPPGKKFDEVIGEQIGAARCIVVLWSRASVESDWIKGEADEGKRRGVLVPALIENVRIPLGFGRIQAADLISRSHASCSTPGGARFCVR
jgi:TIR domain